MILVTHIDLDGAGNAIVARWFFPEMTDAHVYYCDYGFVDETVLRLLDDTDENIILTDLSVRKETALRITHDYPGRVELFDHHKTAQLMLSEFPWVTVDTSVCATKLFFRHMRQRYPEIEVPQSLEKLVFHANDHDLWIHESALSRNFNDMLTMLSVERFVNTMLERIRDNTPLIDSNDRLYLDGLADVKKKYIRGKIADAVVDGDRLVVVASRFISELSQCIRDVEPPPATWNSVRYIDTLNFDNYSHSLRSYDPDFDVSEVAQSNGGGGHPRAAGHPMKIEDKHWLLGL